MSSSTSIVRAKTRTTDRVSPQRQDEQWAGGHMPGTLSDDNVDQLTEEMELYQDEEMAEELDLAGQVNQVERNRHFDAD